MSHLLDTDICIALMRGRPEAPRRRFAEIGAAAATSAIVLFELGVGVEKSDRPDFEHKRIGLLFSKLPVLPFEPDDGRAAAKVLAELERIGLRIGAYDTLIAGQAIARGLTVVTGNLREFTRVPGLKVESWLD
ncbi:MAG TPA: type II toxin-antitoxin system VapC family toxin [Geminicoccaceae bacterium]|nr:type II toxin-antitoxin system VapC family toxin [Geminicoccus sp.]HMU52086.1 type II toxin-antitoxin system VapC family toxin [Geminicoccaceae bacterium]